MTLRETLSLAPGVTLATGADGRRAIVGPVALMLPPVAPGVGIALDALSEGGHSVDELTELAGRDGLTHAAMFHGLLEVLGKHGTLARSVHVDGLLMARLAPAAAPAARPATREETHYRLSRFAWSRVEEQGTVLSMPLPPASVWMPTWHGPALLGSLAVPRLPAELAQVVPGVSAEFAAEFLRLLLEAGAVTEVGPDGVPVEAPALATWEPHDLLFHGLTRWGRVGRTHSGGATYRFRGRLPQPGRKPMPSGERFPLEKPDLAALAQRDPPFTAVLERRRTIRHQGAQPISKAALGELLYRAVGLRHADLEGRDQKEARPYPSGGALYEAEVYVLIHRCEGLEPGLYYYRLEDHALYRVEAHKPELGRLLQLAADSMAFKTLPQAVLLLTARFGRMAWKYETMAYVAMLKHVGVILQTLYLVATAMGLAPCALGNGAADLFARATGIDPLVEGSLGEFVLGTRQGAEGPSGGDA